VAEIEAYHSAAQAARGWLYAGVPLSEQNHP